MAKQIYNRPAIMPASKNIMTPNILSYWTADDGKIAIELAEGVGLNNQPIFGVTVRPENLKASKLFQSKAQAMHYIQSF